MNFLSHFYFDRNEDDPYRVIGMVLPDLVKNARKEWCLRPEKYPDRFEADSRFFHILIGWNRHLAVDRYFHCSAFFLDHTRSIADKIRPFLVNSPVRPSFVAHISLELMLDSFLLTTNQVDTSVFYDHLKQADPGILRRFLRLNGIEDAEPFSRFLNEFIEAEYLNSYRNAAEIIYALSRICMRLWTDPFSETHKLQLSAVLLNYMDSLRHEYMTIFEEIDAVVNTRAPNTVTPRAW